MSELLNDGNAKVLYAALLRMSNDRMLIKQAFQHWVTELSAQPFDVIETVASLEKFLGLNTQERKVLMIGMHAAANRAPHELRSVPDYILGDSEASPSGVSATGSPSPQAPKTKAKQAYTELAEAYFMQVTQGVRKNSASGYRELISILESEGLDDTSVNVNKEVKRHAADGPDLPITVSQADCQNLCHSLYMLVAEVIGPIDADLVSNNAISALLDMEAAARFDPRDLL